MANFDKAYDLLKEAEFSNNISKSLHEVNGDIGGLTYKGITRKFNITWAGWDKIDKTLESYPYCSFPDISRILENNSELQEDVKLLYKIDYWNRLWGDEIKDQKVANSMFLFAVNAGVKRCIRMMQDILGVRVDGIVGRETIDALNEYKGGLLGVFKEKQKEFYVSRNNEKFLNGWLNRVEMV